MPGIPPNLLAAVAFLYPSPEAAESRKRSGGTGFLVGVAPGNLSTELGYHALAKSGPREFYLVTAQHVVGSRPRVVATINEGNGTGLRLEIPGDHWVRHADGDDIAVAPVHVDQPRGGFVPYERFVPRSLGSIGPGNDVFMLSRFHLHDGGPPGQPAVRFGTIAMLPDAPVLMESGIRQEGFLVETHSLSGHSGSPVFANPYPWTAHLPAAQWIASARLLGIDLGHLEDRRPVTAPDGMPVSDPPKYFSLNTGMMVVAPAWKIAEVIESAEMADSRRRLGA